jgi:hypothetical protein
MDLQSLAPLEAASSSKRLQKGNEIEDVPDLHPHYSGIACIQAIPKN